MMTGYDGIGYEKGDRVEIHPATDYWMMGARFGRVIGTSLTPNDRVRVVLDKVPHRIIAGSEADFRFID